MRRAVLARSRTSLRAAVANRLRPKPAGPTAPAAGFAGADCGRANFLRAKGCCSPCWELPRTASLASDCEYVRGGPVPPKTTTAPMQRQQQQQRGQERPETGCEVSREAGLPVSAQVVFGGGWRF